MTNSVDHKHVVLYADDDADDLLLVQEAFAQHGDNVEVITVGDGIEALNYLESLSPLDPSPCLVILDINMPRLNGKEALKEIRKTERFSEVPVVIFTTSSLPLDKDFAKKYNAGFLTKPLDLKQMDFIASQFIEHCDDEIKKNLRKRIN
jgi:CheY-like chemotaxis protein